MFRFFEIQFLGKHLVLATHNFILVFALLVAFLILKTGLTRLAWWRVMLLVIIPAIAADFGGRLSFHLLAEHLLAWDGTGRSYFGALLFQVLSFGVLTAFFVPNENHDEAWDRFAISSSAVYGVLRLSCFFDGCCYGKFCTWPWSVVYFDERALTPLLGFPLHPVQLYSALHGFLCVAVLVGLARSRNAATYRGRLFNFFLILLGSGRFITDFFRGDAHPILWNGLSFHQWTAMFIVTFGAIVLGRHNKFQPHLLISKTIEGIGASFIYIRLLVILALFISMISFCFGCSRVPAPPGKAVVKKTWSLNSGIELHKMAPSPKKIKSDHRNLLLVAVDSVLQDDLKPLMKRAYLTEPPPRLEEMLWWQTAPKLAGIYDYVLRIRYDSTDWNSLFESMIYLENLHTGFDIIMLVHGMPNHLVMSSGRPLVSWKEIDFIQGRFHYLNWVFLQSCYGSSLANDWIQAGAHSVISFEGLNQNFFYLDLFLDSYSNNHHQVSAAFKETNQGFATAIRTNSFYDLIIREALHTNVEAYLQKVTLPVLNEAK